MAVLVEEERNRQIRSREPALREAQERKESLARRAVKSETSNRTRSPAVMQGDVVLSEPGSGAPETAMGYVEAPLGPEIFSYVEQMPKFNGDLSAYTAKLHYPAGAPKDSISRRAFARFIVNEDGRISNITIARSAGRADLDATACRFISRMPPWIPGKQ